MCSSKELLGPTVLLMILQILVDQRFSDRCLYDLSDHPYVRKKMFSLQQSYPLASAVKLKVTYFPIRLFYRPYGGVYNPT